MESDRHELFQHRIDELLVSGRSIEEEQSIGEHLESCTLCREHLEAGKRAIAGLSGFSFEVDPALAAKVYASLVARAQQLETSALAGRRLVWVCLIAVALTAAGSFLDLQVCGLIASLLDIGRMRAREGVIDFWILPTFLLLLLFPMLPLLRQTGERKDG